MAWWVELFGWYATIAFSTNALPQVYKIWTTQSVSDLSVLSYALRTSAAASSVLYLVFSEHIQDVLPLFVKNVCVVVVCGTVVVLYYVYSDPPAAAPPRAGGSFPKLERMARR